MTNGIFGSGSSMMFLALGLSLCAAAGYFLGSVNTAILLSHLKYKQDIRDYGSKNAGMTNVLRTYGKGAAAITLLGDIGKTVIACLIGILLLGESGGYIAGFFCIIGHILPIFHNFKGGKGVLALAATVITLNWQAAIVLIVIFIVIVSFTKYVSLGSVVCALLYPIVLSKFAEPNIFGTATSMIIAIVIVFTHRKNIQRLWAGEENKIKLGKEPMANWKLVIINAVLIIAMLAALVLHSFYASGASMRKNDAVRYGEYYISELQLRYMYIDIATEYLTNGENAETDIVKGYDPEKHLDEQQINGKAYSEYFMDIAVQDAKRLLIGYAKAKTDGKTVPTTDDRCIEEFDKMSENFIFADSYPRYINRVYGKGVGESDIRNIISAQITCTELEKSMGSEAYEKLIQNDLPTVTVDTETVQKIINGDFI